MRYGFGIDVGGTTVKLAFFDETGFMLDKWEIPTDKAENGSRILPSVAGKITRFAQHTEHVLAVGMGIPGPVQHGGFVKRCVNLGPVNKIKQTYTEAPLLSEGKAVLRWRTKHGFSYLEDWIIRRSAELHRRCSA